MNRGVLALDLGTRTGWALYANGVRESGVKDFTQRSGESTGVKFIRFNRWLREVVLAGDGQPVVGLIVLEKVLGRFALGQAQTFLASNFAGRVVEFCAEREIEHTAIAASTLKKWTTGKGNASKAEMILAVGTKWGRLYQSRPQRLDHNEADAIALLEHSIEEYAIPAAEKAGLFG